MTAAPCLDSRPPVNTACASQAKPASAHAVVAARARRSRHLRSLLIVCLTGLAAFLCAVVWLDAPADVGATPTLFEAH